MNPWEDELRQALRREDPGPAFTEEVLRRVRRTAPRVRMAAWPTWAIGMAASLVLSTGVVSYWHQQTRAQKAVADVQQALQITSQTLHRTQAKLQEYGAADRVQRQ